MLNVNLINLKFNLKSNATNAYPPPRKSTGKGRGLSPLSFLELSYL